MNESSIKTLNKLNLIFWEFEAIFRPRRIFRPILSPSAASVSRRATA